MLSVPGLAGCLFLSLSLGVFDRAGDFYGGRRTKAALIFVRTVENVIHKINAARTAANIVAMAISAKEVHSFASSAHCFLFATNTLSLRRTNKHSLFLLFSPAAPSLQKLFFSAAHNCRWRGL